jgi:hypothetical protein
MGEYSDFNMTMPDGGELAAGICHARGGNADLPSQWLIYIVCRPAAAVADLYRCRGRDGECQDLYR